MTFNETLLNYVSLWILTKIGKKFGKQLNLRVWWVCGSQRTRYAPLFSMGRSLTVNNVVRVEGQKSRTTSGKFSLRRWKSFLLGHGPIEGTSIRKKLIKTTRKPVSMKLLLNFSRTLHVIFWGYSKWLIYQHSVSEYRYLIIFYLKRYLSIMTFLH